MFKALSYSGCLGATGGMMLAAAAGTCVGQQADAPRLAARTVAVVGVDSGPVANRGDRTQVVYSTRVRAAGASWVRVVFDRAELSGLCGSETASVLRLTSIRDGGVQYLDAQSVEQWGYASAYFNGDEVAVDLFAAPGTGPSRVAIGRLVASDEPLMGVQDLCGPDNRTVIADNRVGRVLGFGGTIGTGFAISDTNHFFLTAGHVQPTTGSVITFNIPPSGPDGSIVMPPPEDQFAVDGTSVQRQTSGVGNDWCYFGVFSNSNTGLQPAQAYAGAGGTGFFTLAASAPAPSGQTIRITGYGQTDGFNLPFEQSFVNKTDTGPYVSSGTTIAYNVDTTGGNSGSPVYDMSSNTVIGVHYLAGCDAGGNVGTPIQNANLQFALGSPIGICRTGKGVVAGNLYLIGDAANNFGTLSVTPSKFARIAQVGARWTGMAWDWNRSRFYACDAQLGLFEATTAGAVAPIATITGTGGEVVGGLGYDPRGRVLYGVAPASGRLYAIDASSGVATPIGAPLGGTINGLEWDTTRGVLWGIDNAAPQSKLIRLDPASGAKTVVGSIGANILACRDLAFNAADGNLYALNQTTNVLYRINPTTGAGTSVGFTAALTGSAFGMAYANPRPACPQDFNDDGAVDPDDLSDFIAGFFGAPPDPRTDYNADGAIDPDDLSDFIAAYFGPGC